VLLDRAEASENRLRATRVAKAAHLALAPGRWLVAILGADGSPRSVANISSRCQVLPGLRRSDFAHRANPSPNLSHRQRTVSYVTTTLKQQLLDVAQARLRLNRKYQRTVQLMTTAGTRWP
jgi:hypothetical protein